MNQNDLQYYRKRRDELRRTGQPLNEAQRLIRDQARDKTLSDEAWAACYIARVGKRTRPES